MVAYNFQEQFAPAIEAGLKRQTTRPIRKNRHAKIGEKLQLFSGLRTKECRKLLAKEPVCSAVDAIEIHLSNCTPTKIERIVINGRELPDEEIEVFAKADGFHGNATQTARDEMAVFFQRFYGGGVFRGRVIHW